MKYFILSGVCIVCISIHVKCTSKHRHQTLTARQVAPVTPTVFHPHAVSRDAVVKGCFRCAVVRLEDKSRLASV